MLKRTFKIDVTVCPRCLGRLEQIAVIKEWVVAKAILESLREATIFRPHVVVRDRGPPGGDTFANGRKGLLSSLASTELILGI